ncbi:conserved hypothetical protein [Vibrio crassostreae]|nr:conserved hypothetical protein [Vibrio crassostreae]CAK2811004.1 conserved hypothetical protein [Vibrio crassostreae]CAK3285900.1 conserved hypothetical protein [Vibrio crassostreae]CAK3850553.1 conserved hypothetical protein [Vibrio crassostreae]
MEKKDAIHSQPSMYSKLQTWFSDVRLILVAITVIILLIAMYRAYQEQSLNDAISNASNEYGPMMSQCLEQSSTIECLGNLKIVADANTYEAAKAIVLAD